MIDKNIINLTSCQTALFFSSDFQLSPLKTANAIAQKLSSVYSVEPSTVPIPSGAPPEIPRVLLQGDPAGQLSVSQSRADIVFNIQQISGAESSVSQHISDFAECFELAKIIRLGFVLVFTLTGDNLLSLVKSEYIIPEKLTNAKALSLGWIKEVQLGNLSANRLVNFNCNKSFPLSNESVTLVVDTNTGPQDILDLKPIDIKCFIEGCLEQYRSDIYAFIE